ncbi:MAG: hypothetical protein KJO54_01555 [Gammaproteobacteria bacterium]|nr:hypothetical protein [Gammaproteobacteria bacterium]NNF60408.1 hypothetical protein [Gammaproteobacteria bacterium]NNM21798.1 hypothetical protein [Gammaproteobacteria bacterium]
MNTRTICCLLLVSALLGGCPGEPISYNQLSRLGPGGVGIDGYSPVSYFTVGKAEQGDPQFAVSHDGVTYWLTSAGQVDLFNADPARYAPAHGGWCSLMLTGSGQMTPANPESFKILNDRLLLFWSGEFNGMSIDGGKNWESKFTDAAGEQALLDKADSTWWKLLAGGKQKIVLFNESDADRISRERLSGARKQY